MTTPEPEDKKLYEKIKSKVYSEYPKHSAYRSMMIVKKYKDAGGKYKDGGEKKTTKWLGQKWSSVNDYYHDDKIVKCGNSNTEEKFNEYPLCRPLSIIEKLSKPQMKVLIDEKNKLKEKHLSTSNLLKTNKFNIKDTKTGSGNNQYILHNVIIKKTIPLDEAKRIAKDIIKDDKKSFYRETENSYRFRNIPKTKFIKKSFKTKKVNDNISLTFGKLI